MGLESNQTTTANQLYKSAIEKKLTNVTFTTWIENKNKEYAEYVKTAGDKAITFEQWETNNQNPKKSLKLVPVLVLAGMIGVTVWLILKTHKIDVENAV